MTVQRLIACRLLVENHRPVANGDHAEVAVRSGVINLQTIGLDLTGEERAPTQVEECHQDEHHHTRHDR